jgi:hypothetical protein
MLLAILVIMKLNYDIMKMKDEDLQYDIMNIDDGVSGDFGDLLGWRQMKKTVRFARALGFL